MNRCCTPPPAASETTPPARFASVGHRLFSDTEEDSFVVVARQLGMDDDYSSTYSPSRSEPHNEISSREDTCPYSLSQTQTYEGGVLSHTEAATPHRRQRQCTDLFIETGAEREGSGVQTSALRLLNIPISIQYVASVPSPPSTGVPIAENVTAWVGPARGDSTPTCCQTPQPHRALEPTYPCEMSSERGRYGDNVPSLMFTPQIAPGLVAMRHQLDAELDGINSAHRAEPLPAVTPLLDNQLYMGGYPDETTIAILRQLGVRHIVNCCAADYRSNTALQPEFYLYDIDAFDSPDYLILHHDYYRFGQLVSRLLRAGERVFVHCIAGVNRSVTLCAAFLIEHCHLTPTEVVQRFRAHQRMRILENVSFRHQIIDHYLECAAHYLNEDDF